MVHKRISQKTLFRSVGFVVVVFLVRLVFSFLPGFEIDMNTWLSWARRMVEFGPSGFYSESIWTQYTPGFLYWLWMGGSLNWLSELMVKIPTILADILVAGLIWQILKKRGRKLANWSFFLYVLNPMVIFNGSVWGQIDGIFTLFLFLSVYFLLEKRNSLLTGLFWSVAFLIKPQAIVLLPPLIFLGVKRFSFKEILKGGVAAFATIFTLSMPFFPDNPILGLFGLVTKMADYYSFTSVFAFNLWSFFAGMWKPDANVLFGIPYFWWGIVIYLLALTLIFYIHRKRLGKRRVAYLIITLSLFASFLFPTRVHERYLFPMFAFLLISAGLLKSRFLVVLYIVLGTLSFLNLYHPYAYYMDNFLKSERLLVFTTSAAPFIGGTMLLGFFGTLFWEHGERLVTRFFETIARSSRPKVGLPKLKMSKKTARTFLVLILSFSFLSRVVFLSQPTDEYFDEVYHAFTARRMLHGDPAAWEWWNTPPEGFAYEWTHPPLAKELMVLGMMVFGEGSFGWRVPAAVLGTGAVAFVYLIAKFLFKDEVVGLFSAGVFALDGLGLVMSRIGMNDIYFLFFALASIYAFLKGRNFLSALFFGLSLSSKWSAVWMMPIFLVAHFGLKRKLKLSYLWFLITPLVYLVTYIPMFLTGHGFEVFWGVQKQMWWYHTGLSAEHAYTSPWWSWPILLRPIYLYTSEEIGGFVSRIYAMGNPVVFVSGIAAVFISAWVSFINKNKRLGLIVFSYLVFFIPWAASPRIMFLYHYLPSVAFMSIAAGYVLRKFPRLIPYFFISSLLVFLYFFPHWTGIEIPLSLDKSYYWFSSWR